MSELDNIVAQLTTTSTTSSQNDSGLQDLIANSNTTADVSAQSGVVPTASGLSVAFDTTTTSAQVESNIISGLTISASDIQVDTNGVDVLNGRDNVNDGIRGEGGRDYITGLSGNDILIGGADIDVLDGGAGNDGLLGQDDADLLIGGAGSDILNGGGGDDVLAAGTGNSNFVVTGAGSDIIVAGREAPAAGQVTSTYVTDLSSTDTVRIMNWGDVTPQYTITANGTGAILALFDTSGNLDELKEVLYFDNVNTNGLASRIEGGQPLGVIPSNLPGSLFGNPTSGEDTIIGNAGANIILGGAGNDTLEGNGGTDSLFGQDGDDRLLGGADNDLVDGGAGNDQVFGGNGDDTLIGGTGDDFLYGGLGTDTMTGGTGNDTFAAGFETLDNTGSTITQNKITDFAAGDRIQLYSNPAGTKDALYDFTVSGNDVLVNVYAEENGANVKKEVITVENTTLADLDSGAVTGGTLIGGQTSGGGQTIQELNGVDGSADQFSVSNSANTIELIKGYNKADGDVINIRARTDLGIGGLFPNKPVVADLGNALLISITYTNSNTTVTELAAVEKNSNVSTEEDLNIVTPFGAA